jgi:hypothetical protein
LAGRWHYGAPKDLLGRLLQLTGGGFTVRRDGPAIPDDAAPSGRTDVPGPPSTDEPPAPSTDKPPTSC